MNLLIIDWTYLLHRAYYSSIKWDFKNEKWEKSGVVFLGFRILLSLLKHIDYKEGIDKAIIAFDIKGSKSYRLGLFPDYKGTRTSEKDEDFFKQIESFKTLINTTEIDLLESPALEGDDICGILAKWYKESFDKVYIYSWDKDYYQMLEKENIEIIRPDFRGRLKNYTTEDFKKEYENITTKQFIELKALMGDKWDNIKWIKFLWVKGWLKIIKKYWDLSKFLEDNDWIKMIPKKVRDEILDKEKPYDYKINWYWDKNITIREMLSINYKLAEFNYKMKGLKEKEKRLIQKSIKCLFQKKTNKEELKRLLEYWNINYEHYNYLV